MESPPRPDRSPGDAAEPATADAATDSPSSPAAEGGSRDEARTLRAARLELIREQIATGAYDTPDRLDAALDGLLADLLD
ncbi:flagellar biosynthesis anti-sigma factor FlgM [Alienimonas californiensis]|uniref:Anti-sigma-28 factor FlgM C-terminal domain-containing protein n=1 Tax=Alienimonas californiensis TaxID=2527989 RepID=A0A517PES0_9PLAN|nr:flagellar biosynthesis anti-sigma factor FlgM [Alienimonas californiensis]QDT17868.1 hypothetical protein CA12_40040 [Alienimonas californiensis]